MKSFACVFLSALTRELDRENFGNLKLPTGPEAQTHDSQVKLALVVHAGPMAGMIMP